MQRSRSKITRDVRLVFDLFVDKATGASPGQLYVVQYERGERERGQSEPIKADSKGEVRFNFHSAFVSTLQRKNATQYVTKNFRIYLTEHPGGLVVADTTYNLASTVENEMFPAKNFLIRSKEKALKLIFTLSGMSEEDIRKVNNRRSLDGSTDPASPSVARPTDTAADANSQVMYPAVESENEDEEEPASPSIRRQDGKTSDRSQPKPEADDTESYLDDDVLNMVDRAVAEKSARSEGRTTTSAQSTPATSARTPSVPNAAPPPVAATASSPPTAAASREVKKEERPAAQPTSAPPPAAAPPAASVARSVSPSVHPVETTAPVSQSKPSSATTRSIVSDNTIESIALSIKREASVEAATTYRLDDQMALRRDEAEVRRVLSEVLASIVHLSKSQALPEASKPSAAAAAKKSNLKIPNPAMLIIHCLRTWNGPKRTLFIHDLICVLYCEAALHSRYTAEWSSTMLHVLYDILVMEEARADGTTPLTQKAVAALTSDLVDCMEHAARSNFGSANTFAIRGSRSDSLSRIFPVEVASTKQVSLSPTEVVLLCAALDDSLRKLLIRLHANVLAVVDRYCHAPAQTVTRNTQNGFKYTGAVEVGGELHAVEDPSLSIVLHTVTDLYNKLHLGDASSPLVQLTSGEIFRTIFSNINTAFLNHMVDRSNPATPTLRINSPKRGIQFKLCLSMLETWLQQRRMFNIARNELLPCRQYCDLVLLPKVALRNIELREQTTSRLPAALVLYTLKHIQPASNNKWALTEDDIIPVEVTDFFAKLAKEQRGQYVSSREGALKYFSKDSSAADEPPVLPYRTFAEHSIVPFLVELVPKKSNTGGATTLHHLAVANEALRAPSHMSQSERLAMEKRSTSAVMDWEYTAVELQAIASQEFVPGGKDVADAIFQSSFARDSEIKEALVEYSL